VAKAFCLVDAVGAGKIQGFLQMHQIKLSDIN